MPGPVTSSATWLGNLGGLLRGERRPVALCYHGVAPELPAHDPHGLMVREADFTGHLDELVGRGYRLVSAHELWRAVHDGGRRGAEGMAAITFDDGLVDTLHLAARHLEERGGRGTAFVLPGLLGAPHPDLPEARLADGDELRALAGGPLELGAHSVAHADLSGLGDEEVSVELRRCRTLLRDLLGEEVPGLAYPYGRFTPASAAAAEAAGFEYACACSGAGPWHRFAVPREPVFPSTGPGRLQIKAAGLYGPVSGAAEWRSRLSELGGRPGR